MDGILHSIKILSREGPNSTTITCWCWMFWTTSLYPPNFHVIVFTMLKHRHFLINYVQISAAWNIAKNRVYFLERHCKSISKMPFPNFVVPMMFFVKDRYFWFLVPLTSYWMIFSVPSISLEVIVSPQFVSQTYES